MFFFIPKLTEKEDTQSDKSLDSKILKGSVSILNSDYLFLSWKKIYD